MHCSLIYNRGGLPAPRQQNRPTFEPGCWMAGGTKVWAVGAILLAKSSRGWVMPRKSSTPLTTVLTSSSSSSSMSFKGVGLIVGVGVESCRVRAITFCVIWQRKETNAWTKGRGTILLCVWIKRRVCLNWGNLLGAQDWLGWVERRERKQGNENWR